MTPPNAIFYTSLTLSALTTVSALACCIVTWPKLQNCHGRGQRLTFCGWTLLCCRDTATRNYVCANR